jgi:hypothetical protein
LKKKRRRINTELKKNSGKKEVKQNDSRKNGHDCIKDLIMETRTGNM